jgi:cytochrome P450
MWWTSAPRLTLRTMMRSMFSTSLPGDLFDELVRDADVLVRSTFGRTLRPTALNRLPLPSNRRHDRAHARMLATAHRVVAERRDAPGLHDDLLDAFLAGTGGDPDGFTDRQAVDQVLTFFFAGTGTSANALARTLHLLAGEPRLQDELGAEALAALGGRVPAHEHLDALPRTRAAVTEALRLYPPV